jgi:hypothetical protein
MPSHWFSVAAAVFGTLAQFLLFLRWLHRRVRDEEITRTFVNDIATNHLPHIYSALRQIAEEQGITLEDPPLVRFVDLSAPEKSRARRNVGMRSCSS